MYVVAKAQEATLRLPIERYISRFLLVSLNIDAILKGNHNPPRATKAHAITDGLGWGMLMVQR